MGAMTGNPTVVFTAPKTCEIRDTGVPGAGPGELIVRTRRSLISTGTELTIFSGEFPANSNWAGYAHYPFKAGYSNLGTVVETGAGVDPSWKNRRVVSFTPHAAYVKTTPADCHPVPDGVADDQAPFFSIALIVMNGVRLSETTWGEPVAMFGAGLLGQFAARFCLLAGARPVIVVDTAAARLALLPGHPALVPVNASTQDPVAVTKDVTRGRLASAVFEITGNQTLIPKEFELLTRPLGRFVMLSSPRGPVPFDFHDLNNAISSKIIGAHQMAHPQHATPYNPWTKDRHVELFFDWVMSGEFDLAPLVSHRLPADRAPEAYAMLLADRSQAMGVIFDWS